MSYIETSAIKNSTIMLLYSEKDEIQMDPPYQRMGGVWTKEKKQLLIDSILNDYDLPKIYFHEFTRDKKNKTGNDYAVIDGRQRLEAIWGFVEGEFTIASDFDYQREPSVQLRGLSYDDLGMEYPKIKIKFDSFVLPVIAVDTDDEDLIEDMFSRLNEAVPLNAAEKRNSIGGEMVRAIRRLSRHKFFTNNVKFPNKRYQHMEVAARILLVEQNLFFNQRLIDTKKVYLDAMAKNNKDKSHKNKISKIMVKSKAILDEMRNTFSEADVLLSAQGNMVLYYLLFRNALRNDEVGNISRRKFLNFNNALKKNRIIAQNDYEKSSFELLEYDRLTQQGTNDASNIKERFSLLSDAMGVSSDLY